MREMSEKAGLPASAGGLQRKHRKYMSMQQTEIKTYIHLLKKMCAKLRAGYLLTDPVPSAYSPRGTNATSV